METQVGGSKNLTILFTFMLLSCLAYFASATEVTIPLPGLVGSVPKSTTFDFEMNFLSIDSVTIHCIGNIMPGLGQGDGVERPVFPQFEWPATIVFNTDPGPGLYTASFGPYDGSFDETKPYEKKYGATWDYLLDGQGEIHTSVNAVFIIGGIMIIPPQASITEAYLTINGTSNHLTLNQPNGGEFLLQGSGYTIQWEDFRSLEGCPGNYLLDYSIDGGDNWIPIDANSVSETCSYEWSVPPMDSNECLVRVTDENDAYLTDTSDDMFYIYQCQETFASDLNHDCYVDLRDFALFVNQWCFCGNPYDSSCGY